MPDYGAAYADKALRDIDRELRSTYRTAKRELEKKLKDFNARHALKDKAKRQQLAQGKITKQDYQNWLAGQVFIRGQWESKIRQVSKVIQDSNRQALNILNERRLDVFAENYNFNSFWAENIVGGVSFGLYNAQAVARLITEEPLMLPEWKIDEKKDYEWNYKKVNNLVRQGIIQGEGIPEITKRLCDGLATQNENKMRMFARTAITGAQNAGRQRQMEDAAEMGIEQHKQWLATMDSRTRDAHRAIDGEEVPYNEDFSNGLEYPGDPSGPPAQTYNCRCTMITVYPKYSSVHEGGPRRAYVEYEDSDGKPQRRSYLTTNKAAYLEWKEGKKRTLDVGTINKELFKAVSDKITTDEVVITRERISHCNRHNNAYNKFGVYIRDVLSDPDYIFKDRKPDTAILIKRIDTEKKIVELILRLHTERDEKGYKNSIISFWDIGEKTLERYIRRKERVYGKRGL